VTADAIPLKKARAIFAGTSGTARMSRSPTAPGVSVTEHHTHAGGAEWPKRRRGRADPWT
jgi:hypothetical protein